MGFNFLEDLEYTIDYENDCVTWHLPPGTEFDLSKRSSSTPYDYLSLKVGYRLGTKTEFKIRG